MHWLEEELALARPRVVITLGAEVAGILREVKGSKKRNALLGGEVWPLELGGKTYQVVHLAHPGIVMRPASEWNPWPRLHQEEHIPALREELEGLGLT